jgi:hypothetical protein
VILKEEIEDLSDGSPIVDLYRLRIEALKTGSTSSLFQLRPTRRPHLSDPFSISSYVEYKKTLLEEVESSSHNPEDGKV